MKTITAIFFILFLNSCTPQQDYWNVYTVPAGKHKGHFTPLPHVGNEIIFTFQTDKNWLQTANPSGINKICGFSLGLVHYNSARLGWQYEDGIIKAYAYTYVDGVRFYECFTTLQIDQIYTCQITKEGGMYHFRLEDAEYKCPASGWLPGDILLPYVGGEGTFENDWTCYLKIN
jgi:hypothetical protein